MFYLLKGGYKCLDLRWTPHPVIVTIQDNGNYIKVLLYSYYTTITGWGGPPNLYLDPYSLRAHFGLYNDALGLGQCNPWVAPPIAVYH